MGKLPDKYIDDIDFHCFLNREFDNTASHAMIEELAEFAFGSLEEAIEVFEKRKCKNDSEFTD